MPLCPPQKTSSAAAQNPSPTATQPEQTFLEFRRKVRQSEMLSASMEKLLAGLRFSGKLSVVVVEGRILKSGYEEGYFRQKER